jgi:thiol:disulfide interchange protein DsbD
MIDFTADWCVNCKELKEVTFVDDEVRAILDEFVLLKVDVTKNSAEDKALMKRYNVFGPPALIFYKNGQEVPNHIVGFVNPRQFIEYVEKNLR